MPQPPVERARPPTDNGPTEPASLAAATHWEFENRAAIIGVLFAIAFAMSAFDHKNFAVALAAILAPRLRVDGDAVARAVLFSGAAVSILAAATRTWASAYLAADVVYADRVQTASLVADGPYRFVRNPLYLGNLLLAIGIGVMASRVGFAVLNALMLLFSYRLIFREEASLAAAQGAGYAAYRARVPRLVPSITPRLASAGRPAQWAQGFSAELWYWGFALAVTVFAATLSAPLFFVILAASVATLFFTSHH